MKIPKARIALLCFFAVVAGACFAEKQEPVGVTAMVHLNEYPLFIGRDNSGAVSLEIAVSGLAENLELQQIELVFAKVGNPGILDNVKVRHIHGPDSEKEQEGSLLADVRLSRRDIQVKVGQQLVEGKHRFEFDLSLKNDVLLDQSFIVEEARISFGGRELLIIKPENAFRFRPAVVLRDAYQDNVHTYRIPGIITTSKGTLITVYDNRINNSKDLQEDIDVGMSRSTDGGQTWEPMRVIMDMGEWGGRPQSYNGIGDPAVLYDHNSGTIWVAALWMSGSSPDKMLWWDSRPGMKPEETGQFILVKSTDDGLTWSEPINITEQIKNPKWQLFLVGPGMGITLDDGTLVFAAQFKEDIGSQALDGGKYTPFSTIVYSKDGGQTWVIGTGAKPNTTEAQVVQLTDGSLMLNMRDDRNRREKGENNGRAVAITRDMGKTWVLHPSSNSALPEPNCMASLIAHNMEVGGIKQQVLFFSNPNDKYRRINMTIKASFDGGHTWPEESQVLLNKAQGFGYSCLTMVDANTIGIVYEGVRTLYFQKIPVSEFLNNE